MRHHSVVWAALTFALGPLSVAAQRLPSEDRKPPLTRLENWGLSVGVDLLAPRYRPDKSPLLDQQAGFIKPCDEADYGYATTGTGVSINVGAMFLRHFLLGGEIGSVGFRGDKTFRVSAGQTCKVNTLNSITGSGYVGVISSPLGNGARIGRKFWLGVLGGKSNWSGQRQLFSCSGCPADKLRMNSAFFVQPFVMLGGGDKDGGGGIRLAYRKQVGNAPLRSVATLGLFFALGGLWGSP